MKKIDFEELKFNPYIKFAKEWSLITAGTKENDCNTMTASWGHLGSIWGRKPTAVVYIKPSRFTKKFVDNNDYFSISFYDEEYRGALNYLGTVSGRDEDKISNCKLTPVYNDKAVYFEEANLVFICKKIYTQELKEDGFIEKDIIDKYYPLKDFHTMYIGEIVATYIK